MIACLALLLATSAAAPAAPAPNPYLQAVKRLYQNLEYDEAIKALERAVAWRETTPSEDVELALYEGILFAELGQNERSLGSFKRALAIDPAAQMPAAVSPKVTALLMRAREELQLSPAPDGARANPPGTEPSGSSVGLVASVFGLSEVLDLAVGAGANAGLAVGPFEARARVLLGDAIGVGLDASWVFGSSRFRPYLGLRGTAFPKPEAYGGGAFAGLRVDLALGFYAGLDAAFEAFAVAPPYRQLAVSFALGVGFDTRN